MTRRRRAVRLLRAFVLVMIVLASLGVGRFVVIEVQETSRTTARFDPPVWAGQEVPGACGGGFYARHEQTIVITIVGHCITALPGGRLLAGDGSLIGVFGPRAQLADCPTGRFCAPSDFLTLALAPDRVPWGHLNLVDLGAGGYRTITDEAPLACGDIAIGDRVEMDGREHYRTGKVIASFRYDHPTDVIFPCMLVADISVAIGDSGSSVLVNGRPAGIVARQLGATLLGSYLGFTPLAEGLDNLGLHLCTTPDCDLSPASAVQPAS
jgi:hypothetical protein